MRLLIQTLGYLYVEAEIMRKGNEVILNNLKEGVIIIEEETNQVTFVNEKAAKVFMVQPDEEFKISLNKNNSDKFDLTG